MGKDKDSIILERRCVPDGTFIMRQGEPGNSAYLVQSGEVSVFTEHEGKTVELARLGIGQIFGEMALIFDEPRTATVQAIGDCNLIVINREVFKQKLLRSDPTIHGIVEMLTERVITSNNAVLKQKSSVDDLVDTSRMIYQNVLSSLPKDQKKGFQDQVLGKLEEFLVAVRGFQDDMSKK